MGQDDNHWCELGFAEPAVVFKGPTQNARVRTEGWVAASIHPRYRHSGRRGA